MRSFFPCVTQAPLLSGERIIIELDARMLLTPIDGVRFQVPRASCGNPIAGSQSTLPR